jgi:hypothetical protein
MKVEVIGKIADIETIAVGNSIHELSRLRKVYGSGRWRKLKGTATVRLCDGSICEAEVHWYEAHGFGKFVICIKNDDYPVSLELRKIYQVIPDTHATEHQCLRIVDESGEDYVYPADYFIPIELPKAVEKVFSMAG